METKICTKCNKELPKTNKYFHTRYNGKCFRSHCILCINKSNSERNHKQRLEIKKCNTEDEYLNKILQERKERGISKRKYNVRYIDNSKYHIENISIYYLTRVINKRGIKISIKTLEKYPNIIESMRQHLLIKRVNKLTRIGNRNLCLDFSGDRSRMRKQIQIEQMKSNRDRISNNYVVNLLRFSLPKVSIRDFDIYPEIINAKRNQILLHRQNINL